MPQKPIVPPNHGLTPEAKEALAQQGNPDLTDTGLVVELPNLEDPFVGFPTIGEPANVESDGDIVDDALEQEPPKAETAEVERPRSRSRSRAKQDDEPQPMRDAKSGPPSLDEWQGFLSRVVLRTMCDYYLNWAFRGIDEDALSEREIERLALSDEEKKLISVPFAELANKSKFMRKHGRMIVASGDAFNALIVLGAWMSRVNRIASKYRPRKPQQGKVVNNGRSGQSTAEATGPYQGTNGGKVFPGFGVIPGSG